MCGHSVFCFGKIIFDTIKWSMNIDISFDLMCMRVTPFRQRSVCLQAADFTLKHDFKVFPCVCALLRQINRKMRVWVYTLHTSKQWTCLFFIIVVVGAAAASIRCCFVVVVVGVGVIVPFHVCCSSNVELLVHVDAMIAYILKQISHVYKI